MSTLLLMPMALRKRRGWRRKEDIVAALSTEKSLRENYGETVQFRLFHKLESPRPG
jgi:hypothetical protein